MTTQAALFRYAAALPLTLAVASCTAIPAPEAPPPAPAPIAAPTPAPAPPPAKPWDERRLDAGGWRYDAGSRTARFLPTGSATALATMACTSGNLRLTAGLGGGQPLDVDLKTTSGTDRLRFDGGGITLPARDPRLDRIAFSRGRFALEAANGSTLTLPVQSEIGRVIEDCRG